MDFFESPEDEAFRLEARKWLHANKPSEPLPSPDTPEGFAQNRAWERTLFDAEWSVVSWPKEYGGRGLGLWEWMIFEEEYFAAGLGPRAAQNGIFLLAPSLFEFGTEQQKHELLPRIAGVEDMWAQGWSEPEAGSDLAGVRTYAERDEDGGGWRVYGRKIWSTRAAFCDKLFAIVRTEPGSTRHRGLSYLLIDLTAPGVSVRPVQKLGGETGFGEVTFDGAFVPDSDVLGGAGNGWKVAMATTGSERGLVLRSPGRFSAAANRLVDLYRGTPGASPSARREVVDAWMAAEAYKLMAMRTVTTLADGGKIGAESSANKVFWSEMDVHMHETALDLLAEGAELEDPWSHGFITSMATPIFAGTNEIQRNIIAERVLGLPRG
ncbi:acyl-CoA dehydrogenase family protein [Rhodococcus sp. JVH1]|uniref:acyl-CoA dehydrogenase family protein n=1 Tax=Rhodococcus sp. JVH1 TaxID=745408 RepID=UPI000271EB2F|nr:acyl-CoA dehydrogenase family protein [Rhodococcus sp. JVH1]EJI93545.1 acyl-CoA dehydrogenase, middle domain protein [Rhodococcus sp. JVH1]